MDTGSHTEIDPRRAAARGRRAGHARARDERPVPDLPRARRAGDRRHPRHAARRARAGARPAHLPPAAALLGRVLRVAARPAPQRRARSRCCRSASCCSRASRSPWCIHAVVPGMSWAAAFVLGAIVSPTDPVAATAIASRIGVPRRVVTVVEGESLINDATAITAYRVAVVAVTAGTFSAWDAGGKFLLGAAGGVAIGLAVGWVVAHVREQLDDPPVEITISPPDRLRGLPAGGGARALRRRRRGHGRPLHGLTDQPGHERAGAHAGLRDVADRSSFLLNSFLFVLIGLQLPQLLDELREADYDTCDRDRLRPARERVVVRRPDRVGVRLHLRARRPGVPSRRPQAGERRADRLDGDARRGLARRGARAPDRHRRAASRSPSAR